MIVLSKEQIEEMVDPDQMMDQMLFLLLSFCLFFLLPHIQMSRLPTLLFMVACTLLVLLVSLAVLRYIFQSLTGLGIWV